MDGPSIVKVEANKLPYSGSWSVRKGLEVAILFEGIYYIGRGVVVNILSPKPVSRILVRVLEYHIDFGDLKLPYPLDDITYVRDSVGSTIIWDGHDLRQVVGVPSEAEGPAVEPNIVVEEHESEPTAATYSDNRDDSDEESMNDTNRDPVDRNRYPHRSLWRGMDCHLLHKDGSHFGFGRITSCLPDEVCDDKLLGDDDVGVLITRTAAGDRGPIMGILRWPLRQAKLSGSCLTLASIIEYCSANCISESEDDEEGIRKAPYRAVRRILNEGRKTSRYEVKTTHASMSQVCSMDCCPLRCSQHFSLVLTKKIRTRFYLSSFDARRECGYTLQGQLHKREGMRKKYVTLEGQEVCETAWWQIHGISRATYLEWKRQARLGYINSTHGNQGMKRPRPHTIQAEGTIMAIVRQNADLMPTQMKGIGRKRQDIRKVLPSPWNWKAIHEESNRVSSWHGRPVHHSVVP